MNLSDIITLSTGNSNTLSTDTRILATPLNPSFVEASFYNKGEIPILLILFEAFDKGPSGLRLHSTELNKQLTGKSTEIQRLVLEYASAPYFVWTFEYEGKQYKVGQPWNLSSFDILQITGTGFPLSR